jgi:capsular exopolysaccharide synthesis family protein
MELREYLVVLRKRWVTAVIVALAVLVATIVATLVATPQYQATTRLFFAVPGGESVTDLAQGSSFTEKQMSSYAQVAKSPLVLGPVVTELDLQIGAPELARSVRATVTANTVILEITATSPDPSRAAATANAVGAQLQNVVASLHPERPDGTQAVLATPLTPAQPPDMPSSPNAKRNLAIALVLGVAAGLGAALIRESLDTKIRSSRDVGTVTDRAVLGSVAFDPEAQSHPIVMVDQPSGFRAESIRRLRTNLQFVEVASGSQSILITSSIPSEGKTTTAVNLAVALADAGSRVLLIDADLRRPALAKVLDVEGYAGLTSVLIGRAQARDVVQSCLGGRLDVLAAGPVPPNPSELLGSSAMVSLLDEVTRSYDVVLVDSPPLLPVTDAAILSKRVDGSLLVVGAGRTHRAQLRSALEALEAVGANLFGLILNKVPTKEGSGYGASYAYSYGRAPVEADERSPEFARREAKEPTGQASFSSPLTAPLEN